jgi:hypothetical protein
MMELNLLGTCVAASWALSLAPQSWLSVLIAALVFCSKSIPMSLLLLLTLSMVAFIQSTLGSRRASNPLVQKKFFISFLGIFCAILGAAMGDEPASRVLMFLGVLISLPTGPHVLFFNRYYERLTLSSFMGAVVIPSLVGIEILLKIRPEMKMENAQLWDVTLSVLGIFTYIYSSLMAFLRQRMKSSIIYLSLAGVGLALFILMIDNEALSKVTFAAISVSIVSSLSLMGLAAQMGPRYHAFSKVACLGLPGLVGFTAIFFAAKMAISLNLVWLSVILAGYFLQAITLIAYQSYQPSIATLRLKVRFWLVVAVQICSGIGFYWMGGIK